MRSETDANWAAHVLASWEENLMEARKCIGDDEIIEAVISVYNDGDWLSQSYCDEILRHFELHSVESVYRRMEVKSEEMRRGIEGFLKL